MSRPWAQEDDEQLQRMYGNVGMPYMARALNRSEWAIRQRAQMLSVRMRENGVGVVAAEVARCLGVTPTTVLRWIHRDGLPARRVRLGRTNCCYKIDPAAFWRWIAPRRDRIDWTRSLPHALPPEPAWADELRRAGQGRGLHARRTTSTREVQRILRLRKWGYTYKAIGGTVGRSWQSVRSIVARYGK